MGTVQIVLNRYMYNLRSTRLTGERLWRCMNYTRKKCSAFIVAKNHKIVKRLVNKKLHTVKFQ